MILQIAMWTEKLEIFEVNTWVNLELYGTLVMGHKNGWTDCRYGLKQKKNTRYGRPAGVVMEI